MVIKMGIYGVLIGGDPNHSLISLKWGGPPSRAIDPNKYSSSDQYFTAGITCHVRIHPPLNSNDVGFVSR